MTRHLPPIDRAKDHIANVRARPTEMLERQLLANRKAARQRFIPNTRRKTFQHILPYRPWFVREILVMRVELRLRKIQNEMIDNAVFAR